MEERGGGGTRQVHDALLSIRVQGVRQEILHEAGAGRAPERPQPGATVQVVVQHAARCNCAANIPYAYLLQDSLRVSLLGEGYFPRRNFPRRFDDSPPLEALKNGGCSCDSKVSTVNFLDANCSSFPGAMTTTAFDCMDEEYEKAKLAGLDLTLNL